MMSKTGGTVLLWTVLSLFLVVSISADDESDVLNPCFEKCGLDKSNELVQQYPCEDDYNFLPDSIRLPLECFANCTESPFDCSRHGRDLQSRFRNFAWNAGEAIAKFFSMNLFSSSIYALVLQDETPDYIMGFYRESPYLKGSLGELSNRDQGYTPPADESSDAQLPEVRVVDIAESRFWATFGAFQDFFSPHSDLFPHHYAPSKPKHVDAAENPSEEVVEEASDDTTPAEEVLEADDAGAESGIFSLLTSWGTSTVETPDGADPGAPLSEGAAENGAWISHLPKITVPRLSIPVSLPSFNVGRFLEATQTFLWFALQTTAIPSVGLAFYYFLKKRSGKTQRDASAKKRKERSQSRTGLRKTSKRRLSKRIRHRPKVLDTKVEEDTQEPDNECIEPEQTLSGDSQLQETKSEPGAVKDTTEVIKAMSDCVPTDDVYVPLALPIEENPEEPDKMSVCESEGPTEQIGDAVHDILQACTKVQDAYDISKPQELHIGYAEIQQVPMPVDPGSGDIDPHLLKAKLEVMNALPSDESPTRDVTSQDVDVRGFYDNFRPDMCVNDFMSLLDKSVKPEESRSQEVDNLSQGSCAKSMQCTAVGSSEVNSPSTHICATQTQQPREFETPQTEVEAPDNELIVTQMYANYVAKNPQKRWVKKLLQKRLTGPTPIPSTMPKPTPKFERVCSIDSYKQKSTRPEKPTEGMTVATLTAGDVLLARKMSMARHTVSDTSVTYIVR